MSFFNRRSVLASLAISAAACSASLLSSSATFAQSFPSKPITIIVPYPAGGPTDAIARIVAQDLAATFGVGVLVDNRAGASGAIGTRSAARSDADGHTIIFGNNQTHGNNMFLLKEPGYDAVKDFAPLAGVGSFEHIFVVRKDLPAQSVTELVALAKADPAKLNYGSTGIGSGSHLSTELFLVRTGTKMTHVPFRGAAPLVQELLGGRIDVANSTLPSVLAQVQSGDLRGIGLASPQRNPQLPNVPTLREQGITNADADSWAAFFAPVATPKPALEKLSKEILASLAKPNVRDAITKLGFTVNTREPAAFAPYHLQEIKTWKEIIEAAGVKPTE